MHRGPITISPTRVVHLLEFMNLLQYIIITTVQVYLRFTPGVLCGKTYKNIHQP